MRGRLGNGNSFVASVDLLKFADFADFNGDFDSGFVGGFNGDFNGGFVGEFDGDFNGEFVGDFDGDFNGGFNGGFVGEFDGEFDGGFRAGSARFFDSASPSARRASSQKLGTTPSERFFDAASSANVFASTSCPRSCVEPAALPILPKTPVLFDFSRQAFRSATFSGRFLSLNAISKRFQRDFLFSVVIFPVRFNNLFELATRSTDAVEFASFFLNETCRNRRGRRGARFVPRKKFGNFFAVVSGVGSFNGGT